MTDDDQFEQPNLLVGEIVLIDDLDTGFSPENPKNDRPYCVVGSTGFHVRVVPMSGSVERGVTVPAEAVADFDEGWFVPWATTVPKSLVLTAAVVGHLPPPYLNEVLAQAKPKISPK